MRRTFVVVALSTLVTSALGIAINVATGGTLPGVSEQNKGWVWLAVAVLVVAAGGVALVDQRVGDGARQVDRLSGSAPPPPAELPGDIHDFTGHDEIVEDVRRTLAITGRDQPDAVVISAISGMAGIGKTALAVHVAHLVRGRFPDGQFYVNLRGAEAQPLDPRTVLGDFLSQLGMVDLPEELASRIRAYRSRVAGRRMLVVLDNAADEDQVRPLLPGSSPCKVLVTSRKRLVNLTGARTVVLDTLRTGEAVELLGQICGPGRVAAERGYAEHIVGRCGNLPIAIRIAGAVLSRRPELPLARFAEQLSRERSLDVLSAEGNDDVRVSFDLSYQNLEPREQRQFRLLGLLNAPDFPAWVGDVLLGTATRKGTRSSIDQLVDAQLLEGSRGHEDAAGQLRYRFHDLLREFAQERLEATKSPKAKLAATERVLSQYLRLSEIASHRLQPVGHGKSQCSAHTAAFDGDPFRNGVLAWFKAERVSLETAVEQASAAGLGTLAWQLSLSLEAYFERHTHWDSWQHTHELALDAARVVGDRSGEAQILRSLGYLARERGHPQKALDLLRQGRDVFRALGDQFSEARTLCNMIRAYRDLGDFAEAQKCAQSASATMNSCGDPWLEANIERDIGMAHRDHGNTADAIECLTRALPLFQKAGDEWLATYTKRDMGMVHQQKGEYEVSFSYFQESLAVFRRLEDQRGVARTLNSLGVSHREQRQWVEAADCFRRSLDIFRTIGDRRWEAYTLRSLGELQCKQVLALRQSGVKQRIRRHSRELLQWRETEGNLRESQRILDDLRDRPWEARTQLSLGEVYLAQERWDEAIACLDQSLRTFRTIDNRKGEAEALALLDRAVSGQAGKRQQPPNQHM
jgi:tetratricopeptide (TPR) repeat protein